MQYITFLRIHSLLSHSFSTRLSSGGVDSKTEHRHTQKTAFSREFCGNRSNCTIHLLHSPLSGGRKLVSSLFLLSMCLLGVCRWACKQANEQSSWPVRVNSVNKRKYCLAFLTVLSSSCWLTWMHLKEWNRSAWYHLRHSLKCTSSMKRRGRRCPWRRWCTLHWVTQ